MGIPDSFDPAMFLSRTDSTVAGDYSAPGSAPKENGRPSVIQRAGDGTEQLRSAANTKHNTEVPASSAERSVFPAAVTRSNPINLTPGPKHPRAPKEDRDQATSGNGG